MTYRIQGLSPAPFAAFFTMDDEALANCRARRIVAAADRGYPCRVSLQDARAGETLVLVHHVSHDVETPYRSAYAIYVREQARMPAVYIDELPSVFEGRPIALRGFGADGLLKAAHLALPGEADTGIRRLFEMSDIASIHAHNAAHGCFAARIDRH
jgi:hypothetical protein